METTSHVSSAALTQLKEDLEGLANQIEKISTDMNNELSNIHNFWQDGQYEAFKSGYDKQIQKCEEIARTYKQWCNSVLADTIVKTQAIEGVSVDLGFSAGGGAAGSAGTAGAAASGAASSAESLASGPGVSSIGDEFNMGNNNMEMPDESNQINTRLGGKVSVSGTYDLSDL